MSRIPINPGESVPLKTLRVVKWALERGGRFTALELQRQFKMSKSKAYKLTAEWRQVFGNQPPQRGRRLTKAQKAAEIERLGLTQRTVAPADVQPLPHVSGRIDLASIIHRR